MSEQGNDAPVLTEWVEYDSDGATVSAYIARPPVQTPSPVMVLVHENPGLTEHRQDVTRRLARLGYFSITPNLYSRLGGKSPVGVDDLDRKRQIALATQDPQVFGDIMNALRYLEGRPEADLSRAGLFGFCMGGSKGFYTACHTDRFRCYVCFYGPVIARAELQPNRQDLSYLPYAKDLTCPMQYHVGDKDTACPPPHVELLRQELAKYSKPVEFFIYPGADHAFHSDTEPRYHPQAAALAWERAVAFLDKQLQAAVPSGV